MTKISTFVFQIDLTKKNRELKKKLGIYFDSEFPALSIGDVFRAIGALLRALERNCTFFSLLRMDPGNLGPPSEMA